MEKDGVRKICHTRYFFICFKGDQKKEKKSIAVYLYVRWLNRPSLSCNTIIRPLSKCLGSLVKHLNQTLSRGECWFIFQYWLFLNQISPHMKSCPMKNLPAHMFVKTFGIVPRKKTKWKNRAQLSDENSEMGESLQSMTIETVETTVIKQKVPYRWKLLNPQVLQARQGGSLITKVT